MRWTFKLEFTPDGGETITHEIGTITRPIADLRPEEIGLTLAEGHEVVRDLERRMISDQIHAYTLCFRRCPHCGHRQAFKDCARSAFGLCLEPIAFGAARSTCVDARSTADAQCRSSRSGRSYQDPGAAFIRVHVNLTATMVHGVRASRACSG
jgi:hypothetical protein